MNELQFQLMLGNVLQAKSEYHNQFHGYSKVTQLSNTGFTVDYHYPDSWFKPAKLTEEILQKLFFYDEFGGLYGLETFYIDYSITNNTFKVGINLKNNGYINFVHELQNIYLFSEKKPLDVSKLFVK